MSIYVKELFWPRNIAGTPVLSLMINESSRTTPSVYFEVVKEPKRWMLYWNYSLSFNEVASILGNFQKEYNRDVSLNDSDFQIELSRQCKVYSCTLSIKEIASVKSIARDGMPEDVEIGTGGRDGYSYELECYPIHKKYYCSHVVPAQWSDLISLIYLCADKAHLNYRYLPLNNQPKHRLLGCYEELGSGMGFPSMKDYFENEPYPEQNSIIEYLQHNGVVKMISMGHKYDFITGEEIEHETLHYTDRHFVWTSTLIYYVKKYNLRLPKEFEGWVMDLRIFKSVIEKESPK